MLNKTTGNPVADVIARRASSPFIGKPDVAISLFDSARHYNINVEIATLAFPLRSGGWLARNDILKAPLGEPVISKICALFNISP